MRLYHGLNNLNHFFFLSLTPLIVYLSVLSHNLCKYAETRQDATSNSINKLYAACFIILHVASYLVVPVVIAMLKAQNQMEMSRLSPYNVSNEIHLRDYNKLLPGRYKNRLFDVNLTIREISAAYKDRAGYFCPDTESIFILSRFLNACRLKYFPGFEPRIVNNILYKIIRKNLLNLDYYYTFSILPLFSIMLIFSIFP